MRLLERPRRVAFAVPLVLIYAAGCGSSPRPPPAEEAITTSGESHFPDPHPLDPNSSSSMSASVPVNANGTTETAAAPTDTTSTDPTPTSADPASASADLQGTSAPELGATPIGNAKVPTIASLKGKVVVVHFLASWCGPCSKSIPDLNALAAKQKKKGLVVIGVSEDDDKQAAAGFAKKTSAKFPMAWDGSKKAASDYHVTTMPSTFVIDRKGNVVDVLKGGPVDTASIAKRL